MYTCSTKQPHMSGVHLEIDRGGGGGGNDYFRKRGGGKALISTCTLGGDGGMLPQESLDFILSVAASGAFSRSWRIFHLEAIVAIH